MRIRFTKTWAGSYGVFPAGRECELSGPMLAVAPVESYVAVIAEEAKQEDTPANKQQETPVNKQMGTPKDKKAGKLTDDSEKDKAEKKKPKN
jgi:hypothetical protein